MAERVVICHNCGGFGWTVGPVVDDETGERAESIYACEACDRKGYLHLGDSP